jgi:predicted acylesterase/phospholipase RssA
MTQSSQAGVQSSTRRAALIIAGAAGKGPYAAGVLGRLAVDERFEISCVLGASSGALNAAVYAAGLRVGEELDAAQELRRLWREQAHWNQILTHAARVSLVRKALERYRHEPTKKQREVKLLVVAATLNGRRDENNPQHLRFERAFEFDSGHFTTRDGLTKIAETCLVSSAIPVAFRPRDLANEGQFWDGGIVNNTPIGHALKRDRAIDHMIVISPDSEQLQARRWGRFSVNRLLAMAIEERLQRDLCEAKSFNKELAALCRAGVDLDRLGPDVNWKLLQFVEIRPPKDLPGNLASGFFSESRRAEYIEIGEQTAARRLGEWQPQVFDTGRREVRPETTA